MSSIATKHSYRFGYLKSEHWQNLRLQKLARSKGTCAVCSVNKWGNDVHHIYYPKSLYDTQLDDLRVLCRRCHKLVHELLERFHDINPRRNPKRKWVYIRDCARRMIKYLMKGGVIIPTEVKTRNKRRARLEYVAGIFSAARGRLYYGNEWNVIMKFEMPWADDLEKIFRITNPPSDLQWLQESQRLCNWSSVWPQGEH